MLRFEVRDEQGEVLRKFATKHEAEHFAKLDPDLWVKVNQKVKHNIQAEMYQLLGPALI
jgi:hypothetical protein